MLTISEGEILPIHKHTHSPPKSTEQYNHSTLSKKNTNFKQLVDNSIDLYFYETKMYDFMTIQQNQTVKIKVVVNMYDLECTHFHRMLMLVLNVNATKLYLS